MVIPRPEKWLFIFFNMQIMFLFFWEVKCQWLKSLITKDYYWFLKKKIGQFSYIRTNYWYSCIIGLCWSFCVIGLSCSFCFIGFCWSFHVIGLCWSFHVIRLCRTFHVICQSRSFCVVCLSWSFGVLGLIFFLKTPV